MYSKNIQYNNLINFLNNNELPLSNKLLLKFNNKEKIVIKNYNQKEYIVIGNDYGTEIGVDNISGEIMAIDDKNELQSRFVNSNINCLLQFLSIYLANQDCLIEASDEESIDIVNKILNQYKEIDTKAIENDENWWSLILEQTELGLM